TRFSRDWSSDVCSSDLVVDDEVAGLGVAFDVAAFAGAGWAVDEGDGWADDPGLVACAVAFGDVARAAGGLEVVEVPPWAAEFDRSEERRVGREAAGRGE